MYWAGALRRRFSSGQGGCRLAEFVLMTKAAITQKKRMNLRGSYHITADTLGTYNTWILARHSFSMHEDPRTCAPDGLSASLSLRAADATKLLRGNTGDCLPASNINRFNAYIPKGTVTSAVPAVLRGVRYKKCCRR